MTRKSPPRPILGGTLNGERPMRYDYWRTGYGHPHNETHPFWVSVAGEFHCKQQFQTSDSDPSEGALPLYYQIDGEGLFEYDGQTYSMERGDLLIVPTGQQYRYSSQLGVKFHWIALDGDWPHSLFAQTGHLRIGYDSEIEDLFVELREILILQQPGFTRQAIGVTFMLSGRIQAVLDGLTSAESGYPAAVRDAICLLREQYTTPFDAELIGTAVGLSPARLRTLFQKWVGQSPQQYHTHYRIEQAKKLLGEQTLTVYEVASHIGFTDPRYFARVFKQAVGLTPTEYRTR